MNDRTPLHPTDIAHLSLIADVDLSPDGTRVALGIQFADLSTDRTCSNVWVYDQESGTTRRLTTGSYRDTQPKWSPDGQTLAFTSDRDGITNLYLVDLAEGLIRQLTAFTAPVSTEETAPQITESFAWSPAGDQICFSVKDEAVHDRLGFVYDKLRYKSGETGMWDGRRKHLWTVDVATGTTQRLTESADWDAFGPVYSPAGDMIAFTSAMSHVNEVTNTLPDSNWTSPKDIYVIPSTGGDPVRVTPGDGCYISPSFSPDGRKIACNAFRADKSGRTTPSLLFHVWVVDVDGGEPSDVLGGWPYIVGSQVMGDVHPVYAAPPPIWSSDGATLLFQATVRGRANLYKVAVAGGEPVAVTTGEHEVMRFAASSESGKVAALISDNETPPRLHVGDLGEELEPVFDANEYLLAERLIARSEPVLLKSPGGLELDGWLLKPPGYDGSIKTPLIVQLYPSFTHGPTFNFEYQLLASNGYLVLFLNPRGATSYGPEFVERGWWSGDGWVDIPDILAAVDQVCAAEAVDETKLGICGEAYGGGVINWLITETDRFAASVARRAPAAPWVQATDRTMRGRVINDENRDEMIIAAGRRSPVFYADRVSTPHLLMQSLDDRRCTSLHAEEYFIALRSAGKRAKLVLFPASTHFGSRSGSPRYRTEFFWHVLAWFDENLRDIHHPECAAPGERTHSGSAVASA